MPQVAVERSGPIALLTIANPPEGFMTRETVEELDAATREMKDDDSVHAVVFRGGVPGYFIRHYSVAELEELSAGLRARGVTADPARLVPERQIDTLFRRLETMPRPVIAALNGSAMGGGFEFALSCDLRIAEEGDYAYGLPEVRIGILPGAGGTQRLTRLVGTARALEMILRGRTVSPSEALQLGLVHEVAAPGKAVDRALAIANEIAARPPKAVAHIKRLVRLAQATPLEDGLALERTLFLDLLVSDDALRLMSRMNAENRDIRDPGD